MELAGSGAPASVDHPSCLGGASRQRALPAAARLAGTRDLARSQRRQQVTPPGGRALQGKAETHRAGESEVRQAVEQQSGALQDKDGQYCTALTETQQCTVLLLLRYCSAVLSR